MKRVRSIAKKLDNGCLAPLLLLVILCGACHQIFIPPRHPHIESPFFNHIFWRALDMQTEDATELFKTSHPDLKKMSPELARLFNRHRFNMSRPDSMEEISFSYYGYAGHFCSQFIGVDLFYEKGELTKVTFEKMFICP